MVARNPVISRPSVDAGLLQGSLRQGPGSESQVSREESIHRDSKGMIGKHEFFDSTVLIADILRFYNGFSELIIPRPILRVYDGDGVMMNLREQRCLGFFNATEPDVINVNIKAFATLYKKRVIGHEMAHFAREKNVSNWQTSEEDGGRAIEEACATLAHSAYAFNAIQGYNMLEEMNYSHVPKDCSLLDVRFNGFAVARSLILGTEGAASRSRTGWLSPTALDQAILDVVRAVPKRNEDGDSHHIAGAGFGILLLAISNFNIQRVMTHVLNDNVDRLRRNVFMSILSEGGELAGRIDAAERRSLSGSVI